MTPTNSRRPTVIAVSPDELHDLEARRGTPIRPAVTATDLAFLALLDRLDPGTRVRVEAFIESFDPASRDDAKAPKVSP